MSTKDTQSPEKELSHEGLRFVHALRTDIGRRRSENQDSYSLNLEPKVKIYIVADGMGGAQGGATASAIASEAIAKGAFTEEMLISEKSLTKSIERANNFLFGVSKKHDHLLGMGTTVVAVVLSGKQAIISHVGDSRIYRLSGDNFEQLTRDHTLVQELIDSGSLTEDQAEDHPISHMLTRSLGPGEKVEVETRAVEEELCPGDKFLLCCDGLYNMVKDEKIKEILTENDIESAADKLVEIANDNGGTDNITIQIVEVCENDSTEEAEDGEETGFNSTSEISYCDEQGELLPNIDEIIAEILQSEKEEKAAAAAVEAGFSTDNAFESVIFGEQPTFDDIKKHEKDVKTAEEQDTSDTEGSEPGEDGETEQGETSEDLQPYSQITKSMWAVLVVLILIVSGLATLVIDHVVTPTPKEAAVVPRKQAPRRVVSAPAPLKNLVQEEEASGEERDSLIKELEEAQNAGVEAVEENTEEEATEEGKFAAESDEAREGASAEVEALETPLPQVSPEISKVIEEVRDLNIEEVPSSVISSLDPPTDQPIIWEHEEKRAEKIKVNSENLEEADSEPVASLDEPKVILSEQEELEVVSRKSGLRNQIAVIDAKLEAYSVASAEEVSERLTKLKERLATVEEALEKTQESRNAALERFELWTKRKVLVDPKPSAKLINEVAASAAEVLSKKEGYDVASLRYLDAVELWRANTTDDTYVSKMAEYGRELEQKRVELETSVVLAVDSAIKQARFDVTEFSLLGEDLEQKRDRVNRQTGFLSAFSVPEEEDRMNAKRKLLNERRTLVQSLKQLRNQVPDSTETEIRREALAGKHGLN